MLDLIQEGYLGATLEEGRGAGVRLSGQHKGNVIVYGDTSVYFPIMCSFVLSNANTENQKNFIPRKMLGRQN